MSFERSHFEIDTSHVDTVLDVMRDVYDGRLPDEMQLVVEAYEDAKIDHVDAMAYLILYDSAQLAASRQRWHS